MAKFYTMKITVPVSQVAMLTDLLIGSGMEVSSAPAVEVEVAKQRKMRYANGVRSKGIKGDDLIMQVIGSGPARESAIADAFKQYKFAATSYMACLSKLSATGKIKRNEKGEWVKC